MAALTDRDPRSLKPHPINATIYGDGADEDLKASVRSLGILDPLLVLEDGTIVWGHRRCNAAIAVGLAVVPCRVADVDPTDDLAVEELLLEGNRYREKTAEQRAREYERRKRIEAERAKRRQEATLKQNADRCGNISTTEQGKARDKAAEAVGWSGRTAEKAVTVVHAADEAERRGDRAKADDLRRTLNGQGVEAAHRKATGREKPYSPHGIPTKRATRTTKPRLAPSRPPATAVPAPPAEPAAAPPVPPGDPTAADILVSLSPLVASLKRVRETTDGTPFDVQQAVRCCDALTYLLTGEKPLYRLVRLGSNPTTAEQMEAIYEAYPRKVGKADALRQIEKALKKVAFENLMEATSEFARSQQGKDPQFIPHPATWFHQGRWEDDRADWFRPEGRSQPAYRPGPGEVFDPNAAVATL